MNTQVELLNEVWPGIQDDLKSGRIKAESMAAVIQQLGGNTLEQKPAAAADFSGIPGQAPARIPGTNWHVRLPSAGRGVLQLAWTVYKYFHGHVDFGDGLNFANAVEK